MNCSRQCSGTAHRRAMSLVLLCLFLLTLCLGFASPSLAAGTAAPDDHQFIRITGDATALESADVIKCISALRQRHSAFVIGNAVRVEGHSMVSDMTEQSVEDIKAFDVLSAIYENLTPEEIVAVKGLLT